MDGLIAFDLATPAQVFSLAADPNGTPLYDFSCCSLGGDRVRTTTGFSVEPGAGLEALALAQTVVVPGYVALLEPPPQPVIAALRCAADRGARIISVCTGCFALAYAGLLDGRRATTHWAMAAELGARFPAVEVSSAPLFIDEGEVMTSAGLSAGIDLCLHVVRVDFGAAVGERVARHLVASPHREGGQAQFIKRPPSSPAGSLEPTRAWAAERIDRPLDVAAMSEHAGLSTRTFARRFREETGTTPLRWLLGRRVLEARRLLEASDISIEEVAWRSGFGTPASLREHFRRATSTTPSAYRSAFNLESSIP